MNNKLDELPLPREDKPSRLEVAFLLGSAGLVVGMICCNASSISAYVTYFCREIENWVYSGTR